MYMKTATRPSNPAQCIARSVDQRSTAANKLTTFVIMFVNKKIFLVFIIQIPASLIPNLQLMLHSAK